MNAKECRDQKEMTVVPTEIDGLNNAQMLQLNIELSISRAGWEIAAQLAECNKGLRALVSVVADISPNVATAYVKGYIASS